MDEYTDEIQIPVRIYLVRRERNKYEPMIFDYFITSISIIPSKGRGYLY